MFLCCKIMFCAKHYAKLNEIRLGSLMPKNWIGTKNICVGKKFVSSGLLTILFLLGSSQIEIETVSRLKSSPNTHQRQMRREFMHRKASLSFSLSLSLSLSHTHTHTHALAYALALSIHTHASSFSLLLTQTLLVACSLPLSDTQSFTLALFLSLTLSCIHTTTPNLSCYLARTVFFALSSSLSLSLSLSHTHIPSHSSLDSFFNQEGLSFVLAIAFFQLYLSSLSSTVSWCQLCPCLGHFLHFLMLLNHPSTFLAALHSFYPNSISCKLWKME